MASMCRGDRLPTVSHARRHVPLAMALEALLAAAAVPSCEPMVRVDAVALPSSQRVPEVRRCRASSSRTPRAVRSGATRRGSIWSYSLGIVAGRIDGLAAKSRRRLKMPSRGFSARPVAGCRVGQCERPVEAEMIAGIAAAAATKRVILRLRRRRPRWPCRRGRRGRGFRHSSTTGSPMRPMLRTSTSLRRRDSSMRIRSWSRSSAAMAPPSPKLAHPGRMRAGTSAHPVVRTLRSRGGSGAARS